MVRYAFAIAALISASLAHAQENRSAPSSAQPPCTRVLVVRNLSGATTVISPTDFAQFERTSVQAKIPHREEMATYEGVLLGEVLRRAGVPFPDKSQPDKKPSRAFYSAYVLIEAADGYQVVFSMSEVHPDLGGRGVILADRRNGQPLDPNAVPYQVIVAGSEDYGRWIRQVTRILVQPATTSVFQPQPKQTAQQKPSERGGGKAYLVGVGPGDPSLITVKAADVLRSADMVFCFSWMKDEIAPFVPAGALEVASPFLMGGQYCGQRPEDVSADLRDRVVRTNQELGKLKTRVQKLVAEGKTVVFADNGDPLIFSPWGWVPEHLGEVSPVVVPGISSFNAANAALKRGVVGLGSVTLSSGAELGRPDDNGRLAGTIVFFTHGAKLKELAPKLQERYPADTPFAIVCEASYPTEKVIRGALGDLQKLLGQEKLPLLYLLYVGDGLK